MKLNHSQLSSLAKSLGCSERAIERLLGATSVECMPKIDLDEVEDLQTLSQARGERFQVGMRLLGDVPIFWSSDTETRCLRALHEYRNKCPLVFAWLCSGAFDPKKPAENLNRALILHASRTASRLRAKILREAKSRI